MKKLLFILAMVACGGQTIGDLDSGTGNDSGSGKDSSGGSDTGTPKPCTTNGDCSKGGVCGFPMADACKATGTCFPEPGALCNSFSPGCACDGTTINIVCNGLPDGYAPAPLASKGACLADAGTSGSYTCGTATCVEGKEICYFNSQISTCMPANGCTDCNCAQSMFQCISTCKQVGQEIYIQCK